MVTRIEFRKQYDSESESESERESESESESGIVDSGKTTHHSHTRIVVCM